MGPKRDHSATRYPVELIYLIKLTSIIADYQAKTFHRFYTLKYFMCLIIVQIIGLHINLNGKFCTVFQFISDSSQQSVSENIHICIQTSNMTIHWQCNDYYYIRIYACYFSLANHLLQSRVYNREDLLQTLVNSRLFYYKLVLQYNVTVDWPKINLLG